MFVTIRDRRKRILEGKEPISRDQLIGFIDEKVDVTKVDTSEITDMSYLFRGCEEFNQDISNWDTSNVIYTNGMFKGATYF